MKLIMKAKVLNYIVFKSLVVILSIILICGCDKEISITPPEQPPSNGKLFVDSNPPEAFIYLNGKNTGDLTPDTIEWLAEGKYTVTLKKKLFKRIFHNNKY